MTEAIEPYVPSHTCGDPDGQLVCNACAALAVYPSEAPSGGDQ